MSVKLHKGLEEEIKCIKQAHGRGVQWSQHRSERFERQIHFHRAEPMVPHHHRHLRIVHLGTVNKAATCSSSEDKTLSNNIVRLLSITRLANNSNTVRTNNNKSRDPNKDTRTNLSVVKDIINHNRVILDHIKVEIMDTQVDLVSHSSTVTQEQVILSKGNKASTFAHTTRQPQVVDRTSQTLRQQEQILT